MATTPATLLFTAGDIANPAREGEFTTWYDGRHVPQRRALPGFLSARGWQAVDGGPKFMALYELESPEAMKTDAYQALRQPPVQTDEDKAMVGLFTNPLRSLMTEIASAGLPEVPAVEVGGLLVVALQPEAGYEEAFHAWYNTEHIVFGARVPGVLRVRRFQSVDGGNPNFVAVWELKDPGVPSTPAFRAAVETPWTLWTRTHYTRVMRGIYRPR